MEDEAAEGSREAEARRMLLRLCTRQVFSSWANYLAVRDGWRAGEDGLEESVGGDD